MSLGTVSLVFPKCTALMTNFPFGSVGADPPISVKFFNPVYSLMILSSGVATVAKRSRALRNSQRVTNETGVRLLFLNHRRS